MNGLNMFVFGLGLLAIVTTVIVYRHRQDSEGRWIMRSIFTAHVALFCLIRATALAFHIIDGPGIPFSAWGAGVMFHAIILIIASSYLEP